MHDSGIWSREAEKNSPKSELSEAPRQGLRAKVKPGMCNYSPELSDGGGSVQNGDVIKGVNKSLEPA